jgi:hypothetical protein
MAGDTGAAERKIGDAADLAAKLEDDSEPRWWLDWVSPQTCLCEQGKIFGWLTAKVGYRERAVTALQTGYAALPDDQKSSGWASRYLAHLADVHARAGDLGQAYAVALPVAEIARHTGSVRLAVTLAQVHARLAARWPNDPRVAELDEALR